jgi:hypothetical protein
LITIIAPSESDSVTYPDGLGLRVQKLRTNNLSLKDITKVQMKNLTQNYSELQITESSSTTIYGSPAHKIEFTATDDKEQKRKAIQIWTLNDKAYLFTYKADPKILCLHANHTRYD